MVDVKLLGRKPRWGIRNTLSNETATKVEYPWRDVSPLDDGGQGMESLPLSK